MRCRRLPPFLLPILTCSSKGPYTHTDTNTRPRATGSSSTGSICKFQHAAAKAWTRAREATSVNHHSIPCTMPASEHPKALLSDQFKKSKIMCLICFKLLAPIEAALVWITKQPCLLQHTQLLDIHLMSYMRSIATMLLVLTSALT